MNFNLIFGPRFAADLDFAGKQYTASAVAELFKQQSDLPVWQLKQILAERASEARATLGKLDE